MKNLNIFGRLSKKNQIIAIIGLFAVLVLINIDEIDFKWELTNISQTWDIVENKDSWVEVKETATWTDAQTLEPQIVENKQVVEIVENKSPSNEDIKQNNPLDVSEISSTSSGEVSQVDTIPKETKVISNIIVDKETKESNLNTLISSKSDIDTKIEKIVETLTQPSKNDIPENEFDIPWNIEHTSTVSSNTENQIKSVNDTLESLRNENANLNKKITELETAWTGSSTQTSTGNQSLNTSQVVTIQEPKSLQEIEKEKKALETEIQKKKDEEIKRIKEEEDLKKKKALELLTHDTDWDLLSDHIEWQIWTKNRLIDSDLDWFSDKIEINKWQNPNGTGTLFSDILPTNQKMDTIIKGLYKWLVFVNAWDKFVPNEQIYRYEAIKIIVSALYPSEIYQEINSHSWIILYSDIDQNDKEFVKYLSIAIKHKILDWIIDEKLQPYTIFTRAEFIKMLVDWIWKWLWTKTYTWVDTKTDNWFTSYFSTFYDNWMIATPFSARIFPLEPISRYDAIKYALEASRYWK